LLLMVTFEVPDPQFLKYCSEISALVHHPSTTSFKAAILYVAHFNIPSDDLCACVWACTVREHPGLEMTSEYVFRTERLLHDESTLTTSAKHN